MPSLQSVLGSLPGIAGYEAAKQQNAQTEMQQLQKVGALQQILGRVQAQQQKAKTLEMEGQFRAAIANAKTPEEQLAIASKFMGPDALGKMIQSSKDRHTQIETTSKDRQAQISATREAAMARLQQAATNFEANHQLRIRSASNAEERLALERNREAFKQALQNEAQRIAGAQANYNFGFTPSSPVQQTVVSPSGTQPPAQASLPAGVPESDRAAYMAAVRGGSGTVERQVSPQELGSMVDVPAEQVASAPPNNLDARDLRLGGAAPPAVATPATPQSTIPQMPPEIASAPKKVQDQWRLQQTKASIAGTGKFTPQALEFVAKQYLTGDRQAVQGFARSATARIALQNAIVDEAARKGLSPEQTASKMAEYAGLTAGSRTIGQRSANISLAATEAQEMIGIVKETSDKFARTNFVPWNMALKAYESGTGTPEISAFGASVNALVNVYARAINPTGVPTVSDKEHARAVINTVQSPAQTDAVLAIINRELEIAKKAPRSVRESLRREITDGATGGWSIRPR